MKKTNVSILIALVVVVSFFLSSYRSGAGANGWDCIGAESGLSNPKGCSNGGCHGSTATTGITVALELDSTGGVPVTGYKAGLTYTVKLTGTNTTSATLSKFGFQVCCIQGSLVQVTPVNAGTFQQTGLPTGVQYSAAQAGNYVTNVIEQGTPIAHTTGTGGSGTTYVESFTWTAPVAGTGTVSFWAVLNAVNGDGNASSADKWNTKQLILTEDTATVVVNAIEGISNNVELNVYPNPAVDAVQVEMLNALPGIYKLDVFDTEGRLLSTQYTEAANGFSKSTINTSTFAAGLYLVKVSGNGAQKVMKVVKR